MPYRDELTALHARLDGVSKRLEAEQSLRQAAEAELRAAVLSCDHRRPNPIWQLWIAPTAVIAVVVGGLIALLGWQVLVEMSKEAGWGAYPVLVTGLISFFLSLRFVINPEQRWFRPLACLTAVVLVLGALGMVLGMHKFCGITGMGDRSVLWIVTILESSNNVIFALLAALLNGTCLFFGSLRTKSDLVRRTTGWPDNTPPHRFRRDPPPTGQHSALKCHNIFPKAGA